MLVTENNLLIEFLFYFIMTVNDFFILLIRVDNLFY